MFRSGMARAPRPDFPALGLVYIFIQLGRQGGQGGRVADRRRDAARSGPRDARPTSHAQKGPALLLWAGAPAPKTLQRRCVAASVSLAVWAGVPARRMVIRPGMPSAATGRRYSCTNHQRRLSTEGNDSLSVPDFLINADGTHICVAAAQPPGLFSSRCLAAVLAVRKSSVPSTSTISAIAPPKSHALFSHANGVPVGR